MNAIMPRGLCRVDAASYIGVSASMFDQMVKDGRMPPPKRINNRTVWDLRKLDLAFDRLPETEEPLENDSTNPWNALERHCD